MELRMAALLFSVVTGLVALLWDNPWLSSGPGGGPCPLGFGAADGPSPHTSRRPAASSTQAAPSLVAYINASVWTGDPAAPQAQAFVVDAARGRFTFVGASTGALAAAAAAAGGGQPVVDLQGAHVIPGLIDSHLHLILGGLSLSRLDLSTPASEAELVEAVAAAAAHLPPGGWLLGGGWDESQWGGQLPSTAWIDQVTPDTPVWLMRHDAHMGFANSAALRLTGVSAATPDPPGGTILRGADGEPTGLLTDSAMQLVAGHIPPLSVGERRQAFEAAARHALSKGITMVHDMGRVAFQEGEEAAWEDLESIYVPAANEGRLPLRIYAFVALPTWRRMAERVRHLGSAHQGGMLFWGGVKEFADGSLGSRTALFHHPYADQPGSSGNRTIDADRLRQLVVAADAAGLQVAVHAIGDRAVDEVLQVYADLASNSSSTGSGNSSGEQRQQRRRAPHRIEHAQHISGPAAAARMAGAGVAVTPNPHHLLADIGVLEARLGAERAGGGRTYAFKTLLEAGVTAAFASDWPVVPLEPLAGTLYAAVHRRAPGGSRNGGGGSGGAEQPWAPQEALGLAAALAAHAQAGAAVAGLGEDLGSIAAGKLADFVVLDSLGLGDSGERLAEAAVRSTYVGGMCRHGCVEDPTGSRL